MAVPTITSLDPAQGHTGGRTLVEITGTNFNLPVPQATGQTDGQPIVTTEVLFDGEPALSVKVISATRILALTPPYSGDPKNLRATNGVTVDVTLRNLDQGTGIPIPTEEVIFSGLEYRRPTLTGEAEHRSDLRRLCEELLLLMRRQIVDAVEIARGVDYDEDTNSELHVVELAQLPGVVLVGPDLSENRFYSSNDSPERDLDDGSNEFTVTEVPRTEDVSFNVLGYSNNLAEFLNLMTATTTFFQTNRHLKMDRVAGDPGVGSVKFEMDLVESLVRTGSAQNNSNLLGFSGRLLIRAFDIGDRPGITTDKWGGVPKGDTIDKGIYTDDPGAVLDPTEQLTVDSLVVRSILSPGPKGR